MTLTIAFVQLNPTVLMSPATRRWSSRRESDTAAPGAENLVVFSELVLVGYMA